MKTENSTNRVLSAEDQNEQSRPLAVTSGRNSTDSLFAVLQILNIKDQNDLIPTASN